MDEYTSHSLDDGYETYMKSIPKDMLSQEMAEIMRDEDMTLKGWEMDDWNKSLEESYEEEQREYDMLHNNDDSNDNF